MTKQGFLDALRSSLAPADRRDTEEICAYYSELIDDMTEDGFMEAEAVEWLGDPESLAKSLAPDGEAPRKGGRSAPLTDTLTGLVREALSALRLIGDGQNRRESRESRPFTEQIRSLDIRWPRGDVTILCEDRETADLTEERGSSDPPMATRLENGTLFVRFTAENEPFAGGKSLTARLPRAVAEGLSECVVCTASAEVRLEGLSAGDLSVETKSGDVTAENVRSCRALFHTASGDLTAGGTFEALRIRTASGDAELSGNAAHLSFQSASGDLLYRGLSDRIECSTASGDAEMTLRGLPAALVWNSASGDLDLTLPAGSECPVRFDTVSGDFDCRGVRTDVPGEPALRIRTVSGDVTLRGK